MSVTSTMTESLTMVRNQEVFCFFFSKKMLLPSLYRTARRSASMLPIDPDTHLFTVRVIETIDFIYFDRPRISLEKRCGVAVFH